MSHIIVVTGSRDFVGVGSSDVYEALDTYFVGPLRPDVLYHGAARGVDRAARDWADARGVPTRPFPVTDEEWDTLGLSAGPIRNGRMIAAAAERYDAGDRVTVVVFPGGTGTSDCTKKARAAGLRIDRWSFTASGATLRGTPATRRRP